MTDSGRHLDLRQEPDADLSAVVEHLEAGGLIAYATDTVYGLGSTCTAAAVDHLRAVKVRPADKPLLALVPSAEAVDGLEWTQQARDFANIFWPGSVTLVLRDPSGIFPPGVRSTSGTVAVRVSPQAVVQRLLELLGAPLTSTSLNAPGQEPARSGEEARRVVEGLSDPDVWLLDSGTLPESGPSTIIDCTSETPTVLREGTVPLGRLRCVIPEIHGNDP